MTKYKGKEGGREGRGGKGMEVREGREQLRHAWRSGLNDAQARKGMLATQSDWSTNCTTPAEQA